MSYNLKKFNCVKINSTREIFGYSTLRILLLNMSFSASVILLNLRKNQQ